MFQCSPSPTASLFLPGKLLTFGHRYPFQSVWCLFSDLRFRNLTRDSSSMWWCVWFFFFFCRFRPIACLVAGVETCTDRVKAESRLKRFYLWCKLDLWAEIMSWSHIWLFRSKLCLEHVAFQSNYVNNMILMVQIVSHIMVGEIWAYKVKNRKPYRQYEI